MSTFLEEKETMRQQSGHVQELHWEWCVIQSELHWQLPDGKSEDFARRRDQHFFCCAARGSRVSDRDAFFQKEKKNLDSEAASLEKKKIKLN